MKPSHLHSITEIKPEDCYQTKGSKPVKVLCNDLNYYICKYNTGIGFPNALFNEYIAASFLSIWNLPVPEFVFVDIKTEHTKQSPYPFHYFDQLCFGSKFYGEFKEVDKFFLEIPYLNKESVNARDTYLKIGLFDIWLCNEDRHFENFNLLFDLRKQHFVPIDHAQCFNGNNLDKKAEPISENESILSAPFLPRFFSRTLQPNLNVIRLKHIEDFKHNVNRCHGELDNLLANIPLAWNPEVELLKSRLEFYFSEDWQQTCINYFTTLISLNIKSK